MSQTFVSAFVKVWQGIPAYADLGDNVKHVFSIGSANQTFGASTTATELGTETTCLDKTSRACLTLGSVRKAAYHETMTRYTQEIVDLLQKLATCAEERKAIEVEIRRLAHAVIKEGGTWGQVGTGLGCAGQSAWERYRDEKRSTSSAWIQASLEPDPPARAVQLAQPELLSDGLPPPMDQ